MRSVSSQPSRRLVCAHGEQVWLYIYIARHSIQFSARRDCITMSNSVNALCALAILAVMAQECQPARILVVLPMPWKSHHFVYHAVIKALAAKGHQIDYLTAVPMKNPPANVRHLLLRDDLEEQLDRVKPEEMDQSFPPRAVSLGRWQIIEAYKSVFKQDAVLDLLASNDTYDIVMSEFQLFQEINSIWVHKFKALPISLMVMGEVSSSNEMNGLPDNPAYMVDFVTDFTENMCFTERFWNTIHHLLNKFVHFYKIWEFQQLADEVARYPGWEDRPSLWKLTSDMALVLVNMHHAVGHSVPKPPHVKEIGGMTLTGSTELPQDLKKFMDEASAGVVYFSLGSNVNMKEMTKDGKMDSILKMLRELKYKVIMKWTGPDMPDVHDSKVLIGNWLPQLAILSHPKTKVFVTHGGLQGTMETVHSGVAIVGVPIFGDQQKNINFLVSKGCGVRVDKRNFTADALRWAINEVAENPRYREAIMKRSAILRDSPMKPLDEAVYWIEYVLKHGRVLQPASVHMPAYQVYLLDVAAFLIVTALIAYQMIKWVVKSISCKLFGKPKNTKNKRD